MEIIVRFQVHEKSFVDANSRFSRDVFLSSESMWDQLKLIGVSYETKVIQKVIVGCEPTGCYWLTFQKFLQDHDILQKQGTGR